MKRSIQALALSACCVALCHSSIVMADDETDTDSDQKKGLVSLNEAQLQAVGIVVEHAPAVKAPERVEALGLVLDPAILISEVGDLAAAQAANGAAEAELERLRALYGGGAGASLKMLEAAHADQAKTQAQSQVAAAQFSLHWGPLATLPLGERERMMSDVTRGRTLLVRADVLGHHGVGALPRQALLDVDGVQVPGHVLGVLRQISESQSVGLLVVVEHAPAGFGPGARIPMTLMTAERSGRLVRRDALFYDERGAYVYERLPGKAGDSQARFRPTRVKLLFAFDDGWLVDGLDDDDDVVVHGAGALWSLQEVHGQAVDDDDT
jgi:hypothetical protein